MMLPDISSCHFSPGMFIIFLIASSTSITAAQSNTPPLVTNSTGTTTTVTVPLVTNSTGTTTTVTVPLVTNSTGTTTTVTVPLVTNFTGTTTTVTVPLVTYSTRTTTTVTLPLVTNFTGTTTTVTVPLVTNSTGTGPTVTFPKVTNLPPTTKSKCDTLNDSYARLGEFCVSSGIIRQQFQQEDLTNSVTILNTNRFSFNILPVYLVALNVESTYGGIFGEYNVTAFLRVDGENKTSTNFQTVATKLNHFQLQSAISINNKTPKIEILDVAITQIINGMAFKQPFNKQFINYIELVFLVPIDYCNHKEYKVCNEELLQFQNLSAGCDYYDKEMYYYKYTQKCEVVKSEQLPQANSSELIINLPVLKMTQISAGDYIERYTDFEYKIDVVNSSWIGDVGTSFASLPNNACVPVSQVSRPGNYFCMMPQTGAIYTTSAFPEEIESGTIFNLKIIAFYVGFPYVEKPLFVELKFIDRCQQAKNAYKRLQSTSCSDAIKSVTRNAEGQFDITDVKSVLGFRFPAHIISNETKAIELEICSDTNRTKKTTFIDNLLTNYQGQKFHDVTLFNSSALLFEFKTIKFITVTANLINYQNKRELIQLNRDDISIQMFYASDWSTCNMMDCLMLYQNWTRSLAGSLQCKQDEDFLRPYFERCLDLQPEFLVKPVANNRTNQIEDCRYQSPVDLLEHLFVVFNETKIVKLDLPLQARKRRSSIMDLNLQVYNFGYDIKNYSMEGTYRCRLYDPKRMTKPVLSERVEFKFQRPLMLTKNMHYRYNAGKSGLIDGCNFRAPLWPTTNSTYWEKDGIKIRNESVMKGDGAEGGFFFSDFSFERLKISDAGNYRCVVFIKEIMNEPVYAEFNLTVEDIYITIAGQPKLQSRDDGSLFITGCSYLSELQMKFAFYQLDDGTRRNVSSYSSTVNMSLFSYDSYIVNSYADMGVYRCSVFDPDFMKTPVVSMKFGKVSVEYPILLTNPTISSETVTAGDSVNLTGCNYSAAFRLRPSEVFWIYDNHREIHIPSATDQLNINMHSMGTLQMVASLNDTGTYRCAINVKGMNQSIVSNTSVKLDVRAIHVKFVNGPKLSNTSILSGCEFFSFFSVPVFWIINDKRVVSTPFQIDTLNPEADKVSNSSNVFGEETNLLQGESNIVVNKTNVVQFTNQRYKFKEYELTTYMEFGDIKCMAFDNKSMEIPVYSDVLKVNVPVPKFDSSPFLEGRKKVGNNATIFGCRIDMKMDYGEIRNGSFYWLINGFTKITTNVEKSQNTYQFSPLTFQPFKLSDQGYYQCCVFIPGMMTEPIKSERIDIQFSDVSSTEVTMKLNKQWSKDLENKATTGYQDIQKELQNSLVAALTKYNQSGNLFIEVVGFSNYDITSQNINAVTRIMFSNVTNEMRLKYCESFQNLKIGSNNLQISNLVGTPLDCCFRNEFGDNLYKGVYEYNVTLVSDTAVQQQCKYKNNEKTMLSYRFCQPNLLNGPKWSDVNITQCKALSQTTEDLENLDKENVCKSSLEQNCLRVTQLSSKLNNIVQSNGTITVPEDIFHIENIVTEIIDGLVSLNSSEVDQVMDNVLRTVDVIMTTNSSILANAQLKKQSSTNILKQLDKGAETIGRNRSIKVSFKNIALLTAPANEASNVTVYAFEQNGNVSIKLTNNISSITEPVMAQITIPEEAFQGKKNSMFSYGFRQSSFFQGNETLLSNAQQTANNTKFVQSYVLSATILDLIIENLTNPVILKFSKEYFKNVEGKDICEFWDFNLGKNGGWSSNGCKSNGFIDAQYVTCECDHLTNFAILLDTAQTQYNPIELQIITWIGCGISLAGLLLTVLTYLLKRNLRKKLPPKLLISLCLSLMALLIIFLVGVEQTSPRLGCQIVAGSLQYFMLTTFFWMAVEGLNLYRLFVKVFRTSDNGKFLIKASVFAWGLPAIIVGITAGLKPENLGNDKFCVVIGYSFYFGVLVPVAVILLGNFVVLILVLVGLSRRSQATHQSSEKRNYLSQARVAFACSLLLGLSWAFALFAVDDTSMKIFQWLFCIFNSVQGLFIFVFYAVRNKDVRKEWTKYFGRLSLKDTSRISSADKYELRSKSDNKIARVPLLNQLLGKRKQYDVSETKHIL